MTVIQAIKTIIQQNKKLAELLTNLEVGGDKFDDTEIWNNINNIKTDINDINSNLNYLIINTEAPLIQCQNFFNNINVAGISSNSLSNILQVIAAGLTNGNISRVQTELARLGANYKSLYALANTVKTFLESTDTSDTTINRWKEIEKFLQGITDTKTLTGLLEEQKTNILSEINTIINEKTSNLYIFISYDTLVEDEQNTVSLKDEYNNVYEAGQIYELLDKYYNREITNLTIKFKGGTIVVNPNVYKGNKNDYVILINSISIYNDIINGQLLYGLYVLPDSYYLDYKLINYIQ